MARPRKTRLAAAGVIIVFCLPLGGCGIAIGAVAKGVLTYGAPLVVLGKDVLDLDTSWNQSHPDKTPIKEALPAILSPSAPKEGNTPIDKTLLPPATR